jgi:hypothetical protein
MGIQNLYEKAKAVLEGATLHERAIAAVWLRLIKDIDRRYEIIEELGQSTYGPWRDQVYDAAMIGNDDPAVQLYAELYEVSEVWTPGDSPIRGGDGFTVWDVEEQDDDD